MQRYVFISKNFNDWARSYKTGIRNFIKREKLDALAMTRTKKDFFVRMTGRDLIKTVAHECSVAVLFLPEQ